MKLMKWRGLESVCTRGLGCTGKLIQISLAKLRGNRDTRGCESWGRLCTVKCVFQLIKYRTPGPVKLTLQAQPNTGAEGTMSLW